MQKQKKLKHAITRCNHKAKARLQNWQRMYMIIIKKEGVMCLTKYKNPAVIPPLQSRIALVENLQN